MKVNNTGVNESELCKHQDVTADLISEANDDVDGDDKLIHLIEHVNTGMETSHLQREVTNFHANNLSRNSRSEYSVPVSKMT